MKKGDIVILSSLLFSVVLSAILVFSLKKSGNTVVISQNNKELYSLSLYEDKTINLDGNTVEIKNAKVRVNKADCKNQLCVNHSAISRKNESIICLPNRVVIVIE